MIEDTNPRDLLLTFNTPDLKQFDAIIVNSSAGKDSQTALLHAIRLSQKQKQSTDKIIVSHQDLGYMEWPNTVELAKEQAHIHGLRFEKSKYRNREGDHLSLLQYVEARGKWPDNQNRFCTSEFKRGPGSRVVTKISKELRARGLARPRILHIFGFRAEESPARRYKHVFERNKRLTRGTQEVWDWLPIHEMLEDNVWADIRESGIPSHPAYDLGMPRLSCCLCIFAPRAALVVAGRNMPGLLEEYIALEKKIGHSFRHKTPLSDILEAIHNGEGAECTDGNWNM